MKIKSWDEADQTLKRVGLNQITIDRAEADLSAKVSDLKDQTILRVKPLAKEIGEQTRALEEFVSLHQAELSGRFKALNFGDVGFRLTPPRIVIRKIETTLAKLRDLGGRWKQYLRVKEEIDKEALENLSDEDLRALGCTRKQDDKFFAEPDLAKIKKVLFE